MKKTLLAIAVMLSSTTLVAQASGEPGISEKAAQGRAYSPYANREFPTQVYFGDTHVHTALSADAGGAGTKLLPRDAYRLARGEQITSNTGQPVRLSRPLDFYMITDHSDGMGAITDIIGGAPHILADEQGRRFHEGFTSPNAQDRQNAARELTSKFAAGEISNVLNYQPGNPAYADVWSDLVAASEEFNDPGTFTTFAAYEWTSFEAARTLHRNVIFRDGPDKTLQVVPYTTSPPTGSNNPRDLWAWLDNYESETGGRVLAIPHNGNLSNGWMFPMQDDFAEGAPLDAAYAEVRQRFERIYETTQYKGDGEAHPILSPEDEFADFGTWDFGTGDATKAKTPDMLPGDYARSGLKRGLELEAELGVNPLKFGLVGATDTHAGMTTVQEDNYFSKFPIEEPSPERLTSINTKFPDGTPAITGSMFQAAGLTAVWAQENSRPAIWDGMHRRETYATTGPRMRVRMFGGWGFEENDALRPDLAQLGYTKGVPMGSDLRSGEGTPSFLLYALRDPDGANLDRIQIIKGWLDKNGEQREKVYDVAWSDDRVPDANGKLPTVGNTVDLSIPSWTNTIGASELGSVWQDPAFDPSERAFYYARVIEIPTPRWTAYDAVRFNIAMPEDVEVIAQERAYTSPIWYTPRED